MQTGKLFLAALIATAIPSVGSATPDCDPHTLTISSLKQWQPPLDRNISINAGRVTFGDALNRIASAGKLHLSYSADLLPLGKTVCVSYKGVPVGDALSDLLRGVPFAAVVTSSGQIVLAPSALRPAETQADAVPQTLVPMAPVVATAMMATAPDENTFASSLLSRRQLAGQGNVAAAMNAFVPGVWSWQSPAGFTSMYSVRGASSFGVSSPKVFIDGIEVANPLIVSQIAPENIERVEMIRGPQGAALYGADALSGVTNIVTRHEPAVDGSPRFRLRSGVAMSASDLAPGTSMGQDQTLSIQLGSTARSGALNFGIARTGEYMPGGYLRRANFDGNFRSVGARSFVTATARAYNEAAGNPAGLMVDSSYSTPGRASMQQYTLGMRAMYRTSDRITNTIVIGADGFALNLPATAGAALSPADSILRAAGEGALRTTLRFTTAARLVTRADATADFTISAEHSGLHQYGSGAVLTPAAQWSHAARHPNNPIAITDSTKKTPGAAPEQTASADQSRSATGLSAQIDGSFFNRLSVNGGIRLERDAGDGIGVGTAALPMLGASYALSSGAVSIKLRGSYGKGVRWPEMPGHTADYNGMRARLVRPSLAPEQQSGVEGGVDLMVNGSIGLQITHYDQVASGLQQTVLLPASQAPGNGTYAAQSVGEISNRGWEMQAFVRRGALALTGTMSLTDSRVQRIADGYTGDLAPGDRMLAVPARTVSLDASWLGRGWSAGITAARAFDWINYDRVSLIAQPADVSGAELRNFWRTYNGSTHLRTVLTRTVSRGLEITLTGDNLLGKQVGEPDNLTAVPGRTISAGIRAAF